MRARGLFLVVAALVVGPVASADQRRVGQVTVSTTPVQIGSATGRYKLLIKNMSSTTVYCGDSSVTPSTGFPLEIGEAYEEVPGDAPFVSHPTPEKPIYCVTASGSATVTFVEGAGRD